MAYTISNISAQFLHDKDWVTKQDPFLEFQSGGNKVKTSTIKKGGLEATWTESYTIDTESASELRVLAYNNNTIIPDNLLGEGTFRLSAAGSGLESVTLVDKKGNDAGVVKFNITKGGGLNATGARTAAAGHHTTTGTGTGLGAHTGTGGGAYETNAAAATAGHHHAGTNVNSPNQQLGALGTGAGTGALTGSHGTHTHGTGLTGTGAGLPAGLQPGGFKEYTDIDRAGRDQGVVHQEHFTTTEDRTRLLEERHLTREHHPVEKEFVKEVRDTGRTQEVQGKADEYLGREQRVVQDNIRTGLTGTHATTGYNTTDNYANTTDNTGKPGILTQIKDAVTGKSSNTTGTAGTTDGTYGYADNTGKLGANQGKHVTADGLNGREPDAGRTGPVANTRSAAAGTTNL